MFRRRFCGLAPVWGLWAACVAACDAELGHDLSERQANHALVALRQAGFAAEKKAGVSKGQGSLFVLTVPKAQETQALLVLREQGLPRLETVRKSGNFLTLPGELRAEALEQKQRALGETLESLPQVLSAHVHLTPAEPDPLLPTAQLRPTAALLLLLRAPLPISPHDLSELIAKSVTGLDPKDVTVVASQVPDPQPIGPSAGPSRVWFGAGGGLLGALLLQLAYWLWRRRKPPKATAQPSPNPLSG